MGAVGRELREFVLSVRPAALAALAGCEDGEWFPVEALQLLRLVEDCSEHQEVVAVASQIARGGGEVACAVASLSWQVAPTAFERELSEAGPRERREHRRSAAPHRIEAGVVGKK